MSYARFAGLSAFFCGLGSAAIGDFEWAKAFWAVTLVLIGVYGICKEIDSIAVDEVDRTRKR